ncbi:MAG: TetR/AcrR family transcriptional regulator [Alphaproteobacteria bacterium]|jgi:AcrR family transcriptional regulator|nr:TetR/AcrR family transcriptional regulator [Alphaproteobacteria bacterium]
MAAVAESTAGRPENRRGALLDAAARAIARRGYDGTSVRDIAFEVGVQPSAIYYFFRGKDDLFEAVYAQGVAEITDAVTATRASGRAPWARLERAAIAHLEALLLGSDYAVVVASIVPRGDGDLDRRLIRHRDRYESLFRTLIDDLPLPPRTDRRLLRLALLSTLNGVLSWYRPGGDSPRAIARKLVAMFRRPLDAGSPV